MNLTIQHKEIAAWLAHQNQEIQGQFITTFVDELSKVCETHYKTEMQLHYIASELKPAHRDYLVCLGTQP